MLCTPQLTLPLGCELRFAASDDISCSSLLEVA
jgi:hypothetical protein